MPARKTIQMCLLKLATVFFLPFFLSVSPGAAESLLDKYACTAEAQLQAPFFHLMERPDWDYPSWAWAPDSEHIVFQRVKTGIQQIYILNVLTGKENCLSDGTVHEGMPNWSPDGKEIIFVREKDGVSGIFRKNLESQLMSEMIISEKDLFFPVLSPNGRYLSYVQIESEDEFERTLQVMDLQTGETRQVHFSTGWMGSQTWSLDSQYLYFHEITDTGWNDIFEVGLDGEPAKNITNNARADSWSAQFSPDGKFMTYTHGITQAIYSRFDNTEILRKNLETGSNDRLTWAWRPDDGAKYSPDGHTIVFQGIRDGYREFYIMDADGSNQRRLTFQPQGELTSIFRKEGFEAAKGHYNQVRQDDPSAVLFSENAMETLIDSRLEILEGASARWLAEIFVNTYPSSARALKASGFVKLKSGDKEGAYADFRSALAKNAILLDVWREVGTDGYMELLEAIPGIFVDQAGALNSVGYKMLHLGDGKGAIRIFTRITQENPDAWNVFDSLGEAYMWFGNYEKALENYQKSLEINPDNTNAVFHIRRIESLARFE